MFNYKFRAVLIILVALCFFHSLVYCQTWDPTNGPYGHEVMSIAFDTAGSPIVGAYEYMWRLEENIWKKIILLPCCHTYGTVAHIRPIISDGEGTIYQFDHTSWQDSWIWKSTDNGVNWNNITISGLPSTYPLCLSFDKDGFILVGISNARDYSHVGGGLWRSTDQGINWNLVGTDSTCAGMDTMSVRSIAIRGDTIYTATYYNAVGRIEVGKIFKSTDNGLSWTQIYGMMDKGVLSIIVSSTGDIFAGVEAGTSGNCVLKSTDQGLSWSENLNLGEYHSVSLFAGSNGSLFATGRYGDGIFRSTDNGESWQSINNGLLSDVPSGLRVSTVAENEYGVLFAGTEIDGVFKSTDNGDSWTEIGVPISIKTTCIKGSYVFASGTPSSGLGYLHRSTNNGTSWRRVNLGTTSGVNDVVIDLSGNVFVATSSAGLKKSSDNGLTWNNVSFPQTDLRSLAVNSNNYIFVGTSGNGIYKSIDNGNSWTQSDGGVTNVAVSITISKSSKNFDYIFAGTLGLDPGGVYQSTDNGTTWIKPSNQLDVYTITSLAVNGLGDIFAETSDGVFMSTDNGVTWNLTLSRAKSTGVLKSPTTPPPSVLSSVSVDSMVMFVGTDGYGVFRSTNGGSEWTQANEGLTNPRVPSLTLDSAGHLVAGTGAGAFRSREDVTGEISAPITPMLQYPEDHSTSLPTSINIAWHASPTATKYRLQIATDSSFTFVTWDQGNITSTGMMVGILDNGCRFYWRVKASNTWGSSEWSPAWTFRTIFNKPLSPIHSYPPNNTTCISLNPMIRWYTTAAAFTYHLVLATDSLFENIIVDDSTITDTSRIVGPLDNITSYYWKVCAKNDGGTSNWSNVTKFTTGFFSIYNAAEGWNMVSVPLMAADYRKEILFPMAVSNAFGYNGSYVISDTLKKGVGYWLKFSSGQTIELSGYPLIIDTIDIKSGWNMIGSLSNPISVKSICTIPTEMTLSDFFTYIGNSYETSDSIQVGKSYWVKVNQDGKLILSSSSTK